MKNYLQNASRKLVSAASKTLTGVSVGNPAEMAGVLGRPDVPLPAFS